MDSKADMDLTGCLAGWLAVVSSDVSWEVVMLCQIITYHILSMRDAKPGIRKCKSVFTVE